MMLISIDEYISDKKDKSFIARYGFQIISATTSEGIYWFLKKYPHFSGYASLGIIIMNTVICIERFICEDPLKFEYPAR